MWMNPKGGVLGSKHRASYAGAYAFPEACQNNVNNQGMDTNWLVGAEQQGQVETHAVSSEAPQKSLHANTAPLESSPRGKDVFVLPF
jgi:hypothetical protein